MTISLVRHGDYSRVAKLDPRTGSLRVTRRRRGVDPHRIGTWQPVVPEQGWFDWLGGKVVALYRDPPWEGRLWLQVGDRRFEVDDDTRSELVPQCPRHRPDLLGLRTRHFRLIHRGEVACEHRYRPRRTRERLADALDPFPAWPTDEATYDLLCLVDSLLDFREARHRVLRRGLREYADGNPDAAHAPPQPSVRSLPTRR